jgi:hypothetical protein
MDKTDEMAAGHGVPVQMYEEDFLPLAITPLYSFTVDVAEMPPSEDLDVDGPLCHAVIYLAGVPMHQEVGPCGNGSTQDFADKTMRSFAKDLRAAIRR